MATAKRNQAPAADSTPWYQKAFTIKYEVERSEKIAKFLVSLPEDARPGNGTELLIKLLQVAETSVNTDTYNAEIERFTNNLNDSVKAIELLNGKTQDLEKETTALKQETERLRAENEELKKPETQRQQWFESLQKAAPKIAEHNDATIDLVFNRFMYVIHELNREFTAQSQTVTELEERLQEAENRPVKLKSNEAIITFTEPQIKNIGMVKTIMERLGYRFKTSEPSEVIHAALEHHIEICRTMVTQVKEFSPLIELLATA